jgi:PAS domain S-box-containing protein
MRINEPITNREIPLRDDVMLMSRTDSGGRIQDFNQAFVEISGFSEKELKGAPHNIVRHPDMPKEAFADLWATVQSGHPWQGIVKNRCKNGDHYWVMANVAPVIERDEIVGFISIRSKPSRAQVEEAERLYAALRAGSLKGVSLTGGRVVRTGRFARLRDHLASITGRVAMVILLMGAIATAVGLVGFLGTSRIHESLRTVYLDRVVPATQLATIKDDLRSVTDRIMLAAGDAKSPIDVADIRNKLAAIDSNWAAYMATYLTPEESAEADTFATRYKELASTEFEPALRVAGTGGQAAVAHEAAEGLSQKYAAADETLQHLLAIQQKVAGEEYAKAQATFRLVMIVIGGIFVFGAVMALGLGLIMRRAMLAPLRRMEQAFGVLARGRFDAAIPIEDVLEFREANAMLRDMRAKLGFATLEREETAKRSQEYLQREMLSLSEVLDGEVRSAIGDISQRATRLSQGALQMTGIADELRQTAEGVTALVQTTSGNVETVASATEELEASSRSITAQIGNSSKLAEAARGRVDLASQRVAGLTAASARIGSVVTMIQDIAGQTRMLALNATIEAARAGEAGRGFAVVADEVKTLARQTEDGIGSVNSQAEEISRTTREAVETVEEVAASIRDIDAISAEIARAADEQRSATAEIMGSASEAAKYTRNVADDVTKMLQGVETTGNTARRVNELSAVVNRDIAALQQRLYVILRSSHGGNRRREPRFTVAVPFRAEFGGASISGFTADLSAHGAMLVPDRKTEGVGGEGSVTLQGVGTLQARIVASDALGFHVQFPSPGSAEAEALAHCIEAGQAADEPFAELAQSVAAAASAALDAAVKNGEISEAALFDAEYEPVTGSDPQQVIAPHTELVERLFPPLIEPPLAQDAKIVFCAVCDRNGYIAAHNRKYSHPQRPGDRVWNMANARNRRIFDDRAGLLAGRCTKPLAQTYARDLGGGNVMLLKEMDAPIVVNGRNWGGVRLALKLH